MKIKRIKFEDHLIINYISDTKEEITLKSEEKPRPEMYQTFGSLGWLLMQVDGQRVNKDVKIVIDEVSIKYDGLRIESYRVKGCLEITDWQYIPDISIGGILYGGDKDMDKALEKILKEAELFIAGERAQMKLFPNTANLDTEERYQEGEDE